MDTLQSIDAKALPAGRATDRLIAELIYQQKVETDAEGELRVAGDCGHDPTPGEQDVRELRIVPQYSRQELLAEEAFVIALGRAGFVKNAYLCCEPGGIYGDAAWTLRETQSRKKVATAKTKALVYCQAAILTLQNLDNAQTSESEVGQASSSG